MLYKRIVFTIFLLVHMAISGEFPDPEIVWEYDGGEPMVGSPVFFPSVKDPEGIIILLESGKSVYVGQDGREVWRHDFGEPVQATPAVGDLNGDGIPEIVTGTVAGEVVVLNARGVEQWRFPLEGRINDWISPCLPDLNRDGKREILIGDDGGWMNCLSGDGKRLWRMHADPHTTSTPAIVPGSNGEPETIIYGNENDHIVGLSTTGELRWVTQEEGQYGRNNPTVGDLDNDGDYEVVVHTSFNNPNSRLIAMDATNGQVVWEAKLNLHGYVSNTIVDLDGDGLNEVMVALRSNTIYCFEGNGRERWHTVTGGQAFYWTPAVADLDGDGRCEIVAGVRRSNERGKSWFVLNDQGRLLGEYDMPGGANAAPLVADLDQDNRIDIILPGSDKGLLRCITFGGPARGARMEWVSHRYNAARLGYVPAKQSVKPVNLRSVTPQMLNVQWESVPTWGLNRLAVISPKINGDRIVIEVSQVDASGRRESYLYDYVPEDIPAEFPVALAGKGTHKVTIRYWDPSDWSSPQAEWTDTFTLHSFQSFRSEMERKLSGLVAVSEKLWKSNPSLAHLMGDRYSLRSGSLRQLNQRFLRMDVGFAPNMDAFLKALHKFNTHMKEDFALARIAEETNNTGASISLAVWEDPNPWDELNPIFESKIISGDLAIDIPLYTGEYESRALTVVNLRPENLSVQIRPNDNAQKAVKLYEVIEVPRQNGTWVEDALSGMNEAQILRLAPGEARRLWITLNGKRFNAKNQDLMVEIFPIGWEEDKIAVSIRPQVIPIDLQTTPPFFVCNWSSPQRLAGSGLDPAEIIDARDHGVNVYVFGLPGRRCSVQGDLIGKTDWILFDTYLDLLGEDCFVLLSGSGVSIPEGVKQFGPIHVKSQKVWLNEVKSHLQGKGWGMDRWALYPVDEPGLYGGTLIERFKEIATHLKESMPDVPIYANPSGFVTIENMKDMIPLVDVWCPEQTLMRRQPELAPFFLKTGKRVWCYEAPPEVKTLHPLGYYRANSWMAFRLGLSGTGFWTQFYGDLWLRRLPMDYGANYTVAGREVISRRWEAFRDGIEDTRAFALLRNAVARAKSENLFTKEVAEAETLLGSGIDHAIKKAWGCNDITRFLRDYDMDYKEVLKIRQKVAELTLLFQNSKK